MFWLLLAMLVILVIAAAVMVYVAYPHRGEDVPGVPWVGEAMRRGVDAMPSLPGDHRREVSAEDRVELPGGTDRNRAEDRATHV